MRRLLATAAMLVLINTGMILAESPDSMAAVQSGIGRIDELRARILGLEASLGSLKIDTRTGVWNLVGRSSNEKIIQRRGRIVREIATLNAEISSVSAELLKARPGMYAALKQKSMDPGFLRALAYLDSLAAEDALKNVFLEPKDISQGQRTAERLEFLRYKRDMQDLRTRAMERLVSELIQAKKAVQEAKEAGLVAEYDSYLAKLGNMREKAAASRKALDDFLK